MTTTAAAVRHYEQGQTGLWSWVATVDHKRIGVLYFLTALFFFLVGGIEALLLRIQLGTPNNTFLDPETYNQLFTMHGTTMIFLAIMPLSASFFNFVVPLQLGARDVAFPRLNALSYWIFLFGGILLNLSFLFHAAPNGGWFGYANLTSKEFSPGHNIDFWAVGLQILGVSSLAAGFNFIVTILNMRAPGMSMMRMPVFSWMTLVTSFLIVLAFPIITVALILLMFDRMAGTHFFVPSAGADPVLWQHLFWLFGHPEVYILILPAMGIISEVLPVFSRKPLFGYPFVVYSGVFIAFLSFGVWSHHMFSVGLGPVADSFFSLSTMLIAIPTGVKIFNWLGTLWGGRLILKTPMLFALGFIAMFTIGGLSGIMHSSPPADLQQTDTYFVVAHFHYVLFGGSLLGLFAGMYYWFPKCTGRFLNEALGKWHFWLTMIGFNLTFFPMHFVGLLGMPRRIYTYAPDLGFNGMNMASTIGAFVLAVSLLVFVWNLFKSLRSGTPAPADPWNGATLEWSIPSPPPEYNFAVIPTVHSRDPLWAEKRRVAAAGGAAAAGAVASGGAEGVGGAAAGGHGAAGHIHVPAPTIYPLIAALGVALVPAGLIFGLPLSFVGAAVLLFGVYRWAFTPL